MLSKQDDYVTRRELHQFGEDLAKRIIDEISEVINQFAQTMHEQLAEVRHDISILQADVTELKEDFNTLTKRLDNMEANNTVRDAQVMRVRRWIKQVTTLQLES